MLRIIFGPCLLCSILITSLVFGDEFRTWESAKGKRSNAKMAALGLKDGKVRFKRQDGREIDFPISKLSKQDQTFLRDLFKLKSQSKSSSEEVNAKETAPKKATSPKPTTDKKRKDPANADSNVRWDAPAINDDNLQKWIDFIRPEKSEMTWRDNIRWHTSLASAQKEAKKLNRPILLWTMNGNPCGET